MATVKHQIEARVEEVAKAHTLSKARTEAVELTLTDLVKRGEWPPNEGVARPAEVLPGLHVVSTADPAAAASRVAEALRGLHVQVTGPMHKAIAAALRG